MKTPFWKRGRRDDELNEELQAHLTLGAREEMESGSARRDAELAARREFGNETLARETTRDMWGRRWLADLVHDGRYGFRLLRKNPGFTAVCILTLALGIGANTAIFSIVEAVLLRPLPFQEPERIVRLFHVPPQKSFPGMSLFSLSPANFLDWKAQSHSFEAMAAYRPQPMTIADAANPESIILTAVQPDFFSIVGAQPELGRVFISGEDQPASPHVAVLSHTCWKNRFASRPDILGQDLVLDKERYAIIGVMPASIELKAWSGTAGAAWIPLVWSDADRAVRGNHNYSAIARLKSGVSLPEANAELQTISARLATAYPKEDTDWGATAIPLGKFLIDAYKIRTVLLVLFGAVGFVLLIACANIANLSLARALNRRKEMAVRAALGASRFQLIRQCMSESVLLALLGGAAGLALAWLALTLGNSLLADRLPPGTELTLKGGVLAFTFAISVISGLIAGVSPALRMSKTDLNETLKLGSDRAGSTSENPRTRALLIVCEIALAFMLVNGAGLMIRTLGALQAVNPGFEPKNVFTGSFALPKHDYATPAKESAFYDELLRRVRAIPGVESASYVDNAPLTGGSMQPIAIEGRPAADAQDAIEVATRTSYPGYIATMRIPLLLGRDFREDDERAVLVSESMARAYWPNQNPIGRHVSFVFLGPDGGSWHIVGVVGDVPDETLSALEPRATAYQWSRDRDWRFLTLVARSSANPLALGAPVANAVRSLDAGLPVLRPGTMEQTVQASVSSQQFTMWLLAGFSAIALALAASGIYGVLSYSVRRRKREIGIRAALGARVSQILSMVLAGAMKLVLLGLVIGSVGSLVLGRAMQSLLFGVKSTDPLTLIAVSLVLAAVACAASLEPAFRASRVDPLIALRDE
jgi:predicted permease